MVTIDHYLKYYPALVNRWGNTFCHLIFKKHGDNKDLQLVEVLSEGELLFRHNT